MPPTQYIISGKVAPPPNSRDALFSLLQGADPLDPKAPQGPHPHPTHPGTPGDPQDLGGQGDPKGPKGTQGDPRGPKGAFGALGGMGPWGPLGLFRSHSEWKAISSGGLFRKKSHSEVNTILKEKQSSKNEWI